MAFLTAYADVAAERFGEPKLDQLAVAAGEAEERVAAIKPQPLPSVRRTIRLNDGWKQTKRGEEADQAAGAPGRELPSVRVADFAMVVPAGTTEMLDLAKTSGWRYELRWEAGGASATHLGAGESVTRTSRNGRARDAGWHCFRLQADLAEKRVDLSRDGQRVADFRLADAARLGKHVRHRQRPPGMARVAGAHRLPADRRGSAPVRAGAAAHDDFRAPPSLEDWTQPAYDDSGWLPATLPCVHGGFIEAEEDLFLRRTDDLPAARRVLLRSRRSIHPETST